MPVITLTDLAIRHLKPEEGKQVTYLDKSLKGFGVRVGAESMTYILIIWPEPHAGEAGGGGDRQAR